MAGRGGDWKRGALAINHRALDNDRRPPGPWFHQLRRIHDRGSIERREPQAAVGSPPRSRLGAAETTVRTSVKYARDFGYLERRDAGWSVTARCHDQLACYGRLEGAEGFRFAAFLSGHPKRAFHRWRHQPP